MLMQPISINLFVYYGIIVSDGELQTIMKRHESKDMYLFIYGHKLEYKCLGNSKRGSRYVIGKEIYAKYAFDYMNLSTSEGLKFCDENDVPFETKLSAEQEFKVKQKLHALGFFNIANYHLVFNFDKNKD